MVSPTILGGYKIRFVAIVVDQLFGGFVFGFCFFGEGEHKHGRKGQRVALASRPPKAPTLNRLSYPGAS